MRTKYVTYLDPIDGFYQIWYLFCKYKNTVTVESKLSDDKHLLLYSDVWNEEAHTKRLSKTSAEVHLWGKFIPHIGVKAEIILQQDMFVTRLFSTIGMDADYGSDFGN